MNNNKEEEQHLFSVKFYVKIFTILLVMIFMNVGISQVPLPSEWITFLLLAVATTQAVIVCLFFMELIHENKFYSFVWGGAVLFMIFFFVITLLELNGRGAFDKMEGIKYMRKVDNNNNFAPAGPEAMRKSSPEKK